MAVFLIRHLFSHPVFVHTIRPIFAMETSDEIFEILSYTEQFFKVIQ